MPEKMPIASIASIASKGGCASPICCASPACAASERGVRRPSYRDEGAVERWCG